jgi:hypothetical protein
MQKFRQQFAPWSQPLGQAPKDLPFGVRCWVQCTLQMLAKATPSCCTPPVMQCNAMQCSYAQQGMQQSITTARRGVLCNAKAKQTAKQLQGKFCKCKRCNARCTTANELLEIRTETASERRDAITRIPNQKKLQKSKSGRVEEEERS